MYKAVFIDMDGTLLRKDHSVSDVTQDIIQKLLTDNILVVLVSARPLHGMISIAEKIGLSAMPMASLNGAYIVLGKEIIYHSDMNLPTIEKIQTASTAFDTTLIYYRQMEWFAETNNAAIIKEQKITTVPVEVNSFKELLKQWSTYTTGINKIMAVADPEIINAFENKMLDLFGDALNIYTSKPTYLEIMKQDASKKNAVKFLIDRYNIRQDEIIAIGDNFNDKEMIAFAGTGVAMGNAPDEIKAAAKFVTDTNNNDGVAKAIQTLVY